MVTVRIANPADFKRHSDLEFLVDSGAIYTVVPKKILRQLGIRSHSKRPFILANGEKIERRIGNIAVEYKDLRGASPVMFGEEGDMPLLGVTTLEALGLIFDPLRRELKPVALTLSAGISTCEG